MASHNNGTKKVASSPSKSSAAQYSKRKKDLENSKEGTVMVLGRVKHEWNQTDETLQISLFADKLSADQLKAADVEVSDVGVHATFADGREWACKFVEAQEVEGKQSRVVVQGNKLCVWLIKKKAKKWAKLHVTDPLPRGKKKGSGDVKVLSKTQEKVEVLGDPGKLDRHVTSSAGDDQETGCENKVKDEEPVYYLQHTKNDWIESSKNDIFTVHVYVRQAPKDTVKVFYEKTTVTVKFQTKDSSFLALHSNTTEETVFCWKINLKHEILPEQCRHKVTSSLIDITLQKKEPFRWRALEAPLNKAAGVSKSDTWIPAGKSTNQTKTSSTSSQSNVAFDELANVKMLDEDDLELTEDNTSKLTTSTSMFPEKDKENVMQKPMCKVSPLNKPSPPEESLVSPGMTGLENLGNTCFMNSVLQALANTREFRDYFLDARFQKEINTDNVLGSGGKLAVGFAVLMKVLWAGTHYSYAPSKLKNLIALKASQFTGYAQHDAQEFMAFLLDGLHEDLNRIKKKPYIETKDSGDRPDEVVADEAWTAYKKRNDSFVVDLFQGQYKSKLVCPECGKVSITFDPFLYLSVPLTKKKRMLQVIFMSKEPYNKPLRMLVTLAKDARGDQLKEQVSRETGIKPCDMRIFEAYKGRIHKFFRRSCDLSNIQPTDTIIVCEVLSEEVAGEAVYEIPVIQRTVMPNQIPTKCAECKKPCPENGKLKRCTKCYKVGYCDQACQKQHWQYHKPHCKNTLEPVGCPFILSIPQSRATFSRLCKLMEAHARYSVDVFQPPVKAESPSKLTSQLSNSDLSSSSQSGGSLSSLDSQSSLSSTCTLTADGETQVISDTEDGSSEAAPSSGGDSFSTKGDNCVNLPTKGNNSVSPASQALDSTSSSGYASAASACGDSLSDGQLQNPQQTTATFSFTTDEPTVDTSAVDMPPPASTVTPRLAVPSTSQGPDVFSGRSLPTHAVLGLQADDGERVTPQFYVKPVNQYGEGLTGPDGERLEDKGDVPLDLSEKHYLSMDWKNNDRLTPYVLVQTKKLETEDDASVHSAGLKESNITLDQCLRLFTEPEVLAPDEAWYCPQCKAHREATKQMSIWRLPHTLIIQLKRFSFRNFIWRDKIDEMVTFPTRGLDLSPYYIGTRPASEPRALYDLYAVVNHLGGILGGHYTSYVRCADLIDPCKSEVDWRLCDDSRVLTCRESNVVTRAAYVLFYRRRNMFVPLPPAIEDSDVTYDLEEESDEKGTNSVHGTSQSKDDELPDLIPEGDVFIKNQSKMSQPDNRLSEALDFTDMDSVD